MAENDVPYFSPAQRTIGVIAATTAMIAGALAARYMIPEDDVLPFLVVCMLPVLATLAAWRFWCGRSGLRLTRSERQKRYATETLQAPYWQAILINGTPATLPILAVVALNGQSASDAARLLTLVLPIAYVAAATTLHFERRRARRLVGEATAN